MKKFFLCLLILSIFAGFVFYTGWTQRKIAPDAYGIVISKTKGIDNELIVPGKITWKKEFLFPTNAEIKQFKITPLTITKTVNGQLPSGDLYTSIYNSSDNFSYHFEFTVALTVPPESLIDLYRLNRITDDSSLQDYLNSCAQTMSQMAADYILKKISENSDYRVESIRREDITKASQLYRDYPEIEIYGFSVSESKVPDFKLYKQLQNQFVLNQDRYFQSETAENNQNTNTNIVEQ